MASGFEFGELALAVGCAELRRRGDAIAVVVMFETISGEIILAEAAAESVSPSDASAAGRASRLTLPETACADS